MKSGNFKSITARESRNFSPPNNANKRLLEPIYCGSLQTEMRKHENAYYGATFKMLLK